MKKQILNRALLTPKLIATAAVLSTAAFLTACENQDDAKIYTAQQCLDGANTPDKAIDCMDQLGSLSSPKADRIRCSAAFIAQGFTGERMVDAFSSNNSNSFNGMLSYLVFTNTAPEVTAANTLTWCEGSGVKSLMGLAAVARIATTVATVPGAPPLSGFDPAVTDPATIATNIQTAVAAMDPNDPATQEALGAAAVVLYAPYCGDSGSYADSDMCTDIAAAIASGNGDPAAIGQQLATLIQAN